MSRRIHDHQSEPFRFGDVVEDFNGRRWEVVGPVRSMDGYVFGYDAVRVNKKTGATFGKSHIVPATKYVVRYES